MFKYFNETIYQKLQFRNYYHFIGDYNVYVYKLLVNKATNMYIDILRKLKYSVLYCIFVSFPLEEILKILHFNKGYQCACKYIHIHDSHKMGQKSTFKPAFILVNKPSYLLVELYYRPVSLRPVKRNQADFLTMHFKIFNNKLTYYCNSGNYTL